MATPPTAGIIYIIDAAPGSNDPDNYDFDVLTEGTNYVEMNKPQMWSWNVSTLKNVAEVPSDDSISNMITAVGFHSGLFTAQGFIEGSTVSATLDKEGLWDQFIYEERKDKTLYLVVCYASNTYKKFYDIVNGALRQYLKGTLVGNDYWSRWRAQSNLQLEVGFEFQASW